MLLPALQPVRATLRWGLVAFVAACAMPRFTGAPLLVAGIAAIGHSLAHRAAEERDR